MPVVLYRLKPLKDFWKAELASYYGHLYAAADGYVKDPAQREEQLGIVRGWQKEVEDLASILP